jgi:hypothetical protein
MDTVTIKGKEYKITDEPIHGIVRDIRRKQKKLSVAFIMKYKDTIEALGKNASVQEAMTKIAEIDPEGLSDYNDKMEEFIEVSVISLATGKLWIPEDFFDVKDSEFQEILIACQKTVGSDAAGFFGISTPNSPQTVSEENETKIPDQPSSET